MKTQRAAVYLRVSTRDQTLANQIPDLERMISARGFAIAATYQDEESGVKRRPELERLMKDAHRHKFEVVIVWALDRLGRTMHETIGRVLELESLGVHVHSAREPFLDQTDPMVREKLIAEFAWVAAWERRRLIERTNAGLARARAQGKRLGRPSITLNPHALTIELAKGGTPHEVARRLGVGRSTLYRELERLGRFGAVAGHFLRGRRRRRVAVPETGTTQLGGKPPKPGAARSRP